jgi:DNA-binding IclR family transcriptional regulator
MAAQDRTPAEIKTTSRVFEIVEFLMEADGATLTEVVEGLNMVKSTAYRHLQSLEAEEYIVKEENEYYPGMQFLNIGEFVRNRKEVYRLAKPKVKQLAERTDERSEFLAEEHGRSLFVHREVGSNAVDVNTRVGKALPIHATAAGKAILSEYPRERVEEIVENRGLERFTDHTITDVDSLMTELDEISERGVAYNDQELVPGLRAVGVSVCEHDGEVHGGLSITGPTSRMRGEVWQNEFPELLLGVANELELNITY